MHLSHPAYSVLLKDRAQRAPVYMHVVGSEQVAQQKHVSVHSDDVGNQLIHVKLFPPDDVGAIHRCERVQLTGELHTLAGRYAALLICSKPHTSLPRNTMNFLWAGEC